MMPRDSLKTLLKMFPYFLDKSSVSNFYKSQDVTNRRFQDAYNELFKIYESFHLNKRILIWKEQTENYDYVINFVAKFPHLKRVRIYKNDARIYIESFNYDDNINIFEYSYSDSTLNDVSDVNLADKIPQHTFRIEVETHDEYTLTKGFPENDETQGNIYDHDISLDNLGALNNIPRKKYSIVEPSLYFATEPPFNDRESEDDYHYMKRMLEYNLRLHTDYPVLLEIWKLYGIEASMQNRERLLVKMFDENYHNGEWVPQAWEHKDKFCDYTDDLGRYFFVNTSTKTPMKNQPVTLYFNLLNMFSETIDEDYTVDIEFNNETIATDYSGNTFKLTDINSEFDNLCTVTCKNSTGENIGIQELLLSVRGCNNADFYVSENGDDNNPGTQEQPFQTIQKAIDSVATENSIIVLQQGNYNLSSNTPIVRNTCSIMGCGFVLLENRDDNVFFKIPKNKQLTLNDVTLQHQGDIYNVDTISITNHNGGTNFAELVVCPTGATVVELTRITIEVTNPVTVGGTCTVSGRLLDKYNEGLSSKTVRVTCPGSTPINTTTNSNGEFTATLDITRAGDLIVTAKYAGNNEYAASRVTSTISSQIPLVDVFEDYDYVITDMEYVNGDWKYTYKPVSEITCLADIDGAIMNITFNQDKDVSFDRFNSDSTSSSISKTEQNNLRGMLMGIIYEDNEIKYTNYEVN